ncbi:MAG: 3-hydroxyacyl-ACP dehydratase FabZ [Holosporales bacterium]|jgi:3-hydroxyacyl-[acyl-carrier-protein] dehydratase|nr:3-hydroxyacyl-ACP dehydratase FabZ [Holosporales bacterium]
MAFLILGRMEFSTADVLEVLPHRYPFLLIDKVINVDADSATGIKNVTFNEHVFQGHFPGDPIFPGVLIIEALAQTAAVLAISSRKKQADGGPFFVYFMTIDSAKFRYPVRPGDTLQLVVKTDQTHGNVWRFVGNAFVGDVLIAEAKFMAMLKKRE